MGMDYSQTFSKGWCIMKEIKFTTEDMEDFPPDAKLAIIPEYLLYLIISDYGIDTGEWIPRIWQHIYEDFMDGLEKQGIVSKVSGEE